jgi:DNA-binding transcriptional LysR family regulator
MSLKTPFKIPPLSAVRVFEAAARHGSFKKAAEELNITASAVSHAVQNLEDWLGVELFRRGGGKLYLTEPGATYGAALAGAIETIADATMRLPGRRARGRLSISCAPSFAVRWLMPRLAHFRQLRPQTAIDIQTSVNLVDLPMEGIDAAIRLVPPAQALPHWSRLMTETLVPVCSPLFLKKHGGLSGHDLIVEAELIHVTTVSVDWAQWFGRLGRAPARDLTGGLHVDTVQLAIEAARRGFGIALARSPLADIEIASGELVGVLDDSVPSGLAYWLVTMEADFQSDDVKAFQRWILDQAGVKRSETGRLPRVRRG